MNSSLCQCFRNDGRLVELDAQAQMDDGVQVGGEHPHQHVVGTCIASEHVLLHNALPAGFLRLILEEGHEGLIMFRFTQMGLEVVGITHTLQTRLVHDLHGSLIVQIGVVAPLKILRRCSQCPQCEHMMSDVIMIAVVIEEDVMVVVVVL